MLHFIHGLPPQTLWYLIGFQLVLSILVANTASRRGRSALLFFLLSFLLSPLLAYIILAVLGDRFGGQVGVPDRLSNERVIQPWQQSQLRRLGVNDQSLLREIGEDQAKSVIAQVQRQGQYVGFVPMFILLLLAAVACYVVYNHFQKPDQSLFPDGGGLTESVSTFESQPPPNTSWLSPGPTRPLPPGMLLITRPVTIDVSYGQVRLPVGTPVNFIVEGNGRVVFQYGHDIASVPTTATNYPR
jgi:hypothetical protein